MDYLNIKKNISGHKWRVLFCSVAIGLLIMFLFSGKSRIDLESIAVSPDEQYVACFETGNGHKVRCFRTNGSLAFDYLVPPDVSAGGYCTLWFEDNVLCVLFYRTNIVVYFTMDGTILKSATYTAEEHPPEFPLFTKDGHKYVFKGDDINVVYDKGGFWGYWFFGSERYLATITKNGQTEIIYSWTAKGQITGVTD